MLYMSLKDKCLTSFVAKGYVSEFGGSSCYQVFNNEVFMKQKPCSQQYEYTSSSTDFLNNALSDNMTDNVLERLTLNCELARRVCVSHKWTSEIENDRFECLLDLVNAAKKYSSNFVCTKKLIDNRVQESKTGLSPKIKRVTNSYTVPRSKVQNKLYALFNLKACRKFVAFITVTFPAGCADSVACSLFKYWLNYCRKTYNLNTYLWVLERQKNGTLHFHMLTNNFLPVQQVNRAMAIIINNAVIRGELVWGNSCLERYNGVDIDSIYNSKRHKKTGKCLNPSQIRAWLSAYVTKYVTKNKSEFSCLAWHCSRSVSMLFTSTVLLFENRDLITMYLPRARGMYKVIRDKFFTCSIFLFTPDQTIYYRIRWFNDQIYNECTTYKFNSNNKITFKSISL